MADIFQDVTNDNTDTNWGIFEVVNDIVQGVATGVGLDDLVATLDEKKIQWGVLKVFGVDQQDNVTSKRVKLVQINWVGPKVPAKHRSVALSGKSHVGQLIKGVTLTLDSNDKDDLTPVIIGKALLKSGGAHKPTHYDFGGGKTYSLEELGFN